MCTEATRDRLLKLLEILSSQIKMSEDIALFYVALQTDALPVGESISIKVEGSYVLLLPSHKIPRVKGNCNYLLIKQLYKISFFLQHFTNCSLKIKMENKNLLWQVPVM